jgi:DNA-binding MarR family transcriptional regulator
VTRAEVTGQTDGTPFSKAEYEALAAFRHELRRFLRFSEEAARRHGITPQQHQLLLALKGFPGRDWATIRELADRLQLRHHSVVGEVDRAAAAGLVARAPHAADRRAVEVRLTADGERLLQSLTAAHRGELRRVRRRLAALEPLLPPGSDP